MQQVRRSLGLNHCLGYPGRSGDLLLTTRGSSVTASGGFGDKMS